MKISLNNCSNYKTSSNRAIESQNRAKINFAQKTDTVKINSEKDYTDYIETHLAGETAIKERETKKPVKTFITKENKGNVSEFMMFKDNKKLGYLRVDNASPIQTGIPSYIEKAPNKVLEVLILTSYKGDEYSGIGTELIKTAIEESKNRGFEGHIILRANNRLREEFVGYRKNESPVPFYYNFGFESKPFYNFLAKTFSKFTKNYEFEPHLPMYLGDESRKKWLNSIEKSHILYTN